MSFLTSLHGKSTAKLWAAGAGIIVVGYATKLATWELVRQNVTETMEREQKAAMGAYGESSKRHWPYKSNRFNHLLCPVIKSVFFTWTQRKPERAPTSFNSQKSTCKASTWRRHDESAQKPSRRLSRTSRGARNQGRLQGKERATHATKNIEWPKKAT